MRKSLLHTTALAAVLSLAAIPVYAQGADQNAQPGAGGGAEVQGRDGAPAAGQKAPGAGGSSTMDKDGKARAEGNAGERGGSKVEGAGNTPSEKQARDAKESDKKAMGGKDASEKPGDRAASDKADGEKKDGRNADADKGDRGNDRADNRDGKKGGDRVKVTLNNDQRTKIKTVIKDGGRARTNVRFNIRVGERVPSTVVYYDLPPTLIEIVPEYRSYRYVLVGDDIIIVDPDTGEIVDVIPA